jgi:hypothetical protein
MKYLEFFGICCMKFRFKKKTLRYVHMVVTDVDEISQDSLLKVLNKLFFVIDLFFFQKENLNKLTTIIRFKWNNHDGVN